jgi:hypothetical protein
MEIYDFSKREKGTKGFSINVSQKEALHLIVSLATQIVNNDCNTNRLESKIDWTDGRETVYDLYFSIYVEDTSKNK